ncbi:MAG: MBL fold metallo-hydrolase [Anaerolineae bacterium]
MPLRTATYLGTAGWAFGSALLLDPFLTRASLWDVLARPLVPDEAAIRALAAAHGLHADHILVSHPHYAHIMDVPALHRITGARVHTTPQGVELLAALGTPAQALRPGAVLELSGIRVAVYPSRHRLIAGRIPYTGRPDRTPPLRARDYRMDEQLSFLLAAEGRRVLVASGIDDEPHVPADVLICGADTRPRVLHTLLEAVSPRLVLPTHWDDMFRGFDTPIRPMRLPRFPLRRIDVAGFVRRVEAFGARVVVPGWFETVDLGGV